MRILNLKKRLIFVLAKAMKLKVYIVDPETNQIVHPDITNRIRFTTEEANKIFEKYGL